MTYIYDILLNFNQDFYEFYEWDKGDNLTIVKKIPLLKVSSSVIDDVLTKKIKIEDPFVLDLNTEIFENKKNKILKYTFLITDTYRVLAISLNQDLILTKISDLLLEENIDALNISKRCKLTEIAYTIIDTKKNNCFLTRNELKIKNYLIQEFTRIKKENDLEKLKYLYFEYFNKTPVKENYYQELLNSLDHDVTKNHLKLYKLIKLIYSS